MNEIVVILITVFKIVFMYGAMQEGEILFPLRRALEWITSWMPIGAQHYVRKPLFDCMFCMSGIWGLFFLWCPMPLWLEIILTIAGFNYLLSAAVGYLHEAKESAEEKQTDIEKRISDLEDDMWPLGKFRMPE